MEKAKGESGMELAFDKILTSSCEGERIDYGILFGNEKIVFIKSGAAGKIKGYGEKYLKMAHRVRKRMGATVICASNPDVSHSSIDEKTIRSVVSMQKLTHFELYFVGTSDGAYQNFELAEIFKETVKMLSINSSYIELEELKNKILAFGNVDKIFVCGTKDEDYKRLKTLKEMENEKFHYVEIAGADHKFVGMLDEFIALIDLI